MTKKIKWDIGLVATAVVLLTAMVCVSCDSGNSQTISEKSVEAAHVEAIEATPVYSVKKLTKGQFTNKKWNYEGIDDEFDGFTGVVSQNGSKIESDLYLLASSTTFYIRTKNGVTEMFIDNMWDDAEFDPSYQVALKLDSNNTVNVMCTSGSKGSLFINGQIANTILDVISKKNYKTLKMRIRLKSGNVLDVQFELDGLMHYIKHS